MKRNMQVYAFDDSADVFGLSQKMMRLPSWVRALSMKHTPAMRMMRVMEIIAAEAKAAETKAGGERCSAAVPWKPKGTWQIFLSKPQICRRQNLRPILCGLWRIWNSASQLLAAVRHSSTR